MYEHLQQSIEVCWDQSLPLCAAFWLSSQERRENFNFDATWSLERTFTFGLPNGDIDYFDIVAGVLQGDTLATYLLIIYLDYVLRTSIDKMKENGFKLAKERNRRYPAQTITDADYADDIALIVNTSAPGKTMLNSLERVAGGIGSHVNADKTEYMCFNQRGHISTLKGGPLKLVDKFIYLGSSASSTETDINMRLAKAWTAIDRLSVTWKSDLADKIKRSSFQAAVMSILLYGCTR